MPLCSVFIERYILANVNEWLLKCSIANKSRAAARRMHALVLGILYVSRC